MPTQLTYQGSEYTRDGEHTGFRVHYLAPNGAPPDNRNDVYVMLTDQDIDAIVALPANQRAQKLRDMVNKRLGYTLNGDAQIDTALGGANANVTI